ncbi:hypothetical protein HHE014_09590 [Helicobacter heilmannii]|nr:hypothetical protein HHE014_09590 [Helicobacter heilmannii]
MLVFLLVGQLCIGLFRLHWGFWLGTKNHQSVKILGLILVIAEIVVFFYRDRF